MNYSFLGWIIISIGVAATATPALAQPYPAKSIRVIVPFAPGGNTDIIGRIFAPRMGEVIGQQIIIDNRGGAGSTIGTEIAARWPTVPRPAVE